MERHRFDGISFFFGLVFTAMASLVLFADDLEVFDVRWVWPALLIVGGVALLVSMFTRDDGGEADLDSVEPAGAKDSLDAAKAELPPDPFR